MIDVDAPNDLGDELAIYLNDYPLALHEPDDGVRRRNRAVLVHTVPNRVEVTRWHIHGDDLHITPGRARTYRTAAAAARWARAHLLA